MANFFHPFRKKSLGQSFQLAIRHPAFSTDTPHFDANVIQNRLAPREFRAAGVSVRLVTPASVFRHHIINTQPKRVSPTLSHQRNKIR